VTRRSQVAAVFVAVIGLGVLAAFFVLRRDGGDDQALSTISNRGRPIELEFGVRISAGEAKPTGEVMLLAERAGLRFLHAEGKVIWRGAGVPPPAE
jgi:hypothetical protein